MLRGRQRAIIREGVYAINLALFIVITEDVVCHLSVQGRAELEKLIGWQKELREVNGFSPVVIGELLTAPDPLVPGGASFGGVIRIWVPFPDTYTIYAFVSDTEGNVMTFTPGVFQITGGSYFNFTPTFAPLPSDLYKFHVLVVASGSGLITFSDFYQFRIGGPNSNGCCP